ncbi:MAG: hypothetical protein AAF367_10540 [Pseudomonadota bacterium]
MWFLTDRVISQGGGLLFMACLARAVPTMEAAYFIAAFAFASLFQPLFANACQPLAIQLWHREGVPGFCAIWFLMVTVAVVFIGAMILWQVAAGHPVAAALLLHALLAPLSLASAPLIAEDRWRTALGVLIPVTLLGVAARIAALLIFDDLLLAALCFSIEPLCGGVLLSLRAGLLRGLRPARLRSELLRDAVPLMLAMVASTLFWRAPVLAGALFLSADTLLPLAFAMQILTGLMLVPNALCQSLIGPISTGGDARREALQAGGATAVVASISAVIACLVAAQPVLSLVYGPAAAGGGVILSWLSPVIGLATIWRLTELTAGLDGHRRDLLITRLTASACQAAICALLFFWPSAIMIAAMSPLSLVFAAVFAPMLLPSLRPALAEMAAGIRTMITFSGLRATGAIFLRG